MTKDMRIAMATTFLIWLGLSLICAGGGSFIWAEEGETPLAPPVSSAEMMQREIDRRREETFQLNEILDLADRLFRSGEWDHAEAKYTLVLRETDPQSQSGGFHQRARIGKARCLAAKAFAKEEEGKMAEAAGLMSQAAELDPTNQSLARKAAALQEAGSRLTDPFPGNSAVTDDLVRKTSEIKKLLSLSDQLMETGQYVEARQKLDDVLRVASRQKHAH